MMEYQIKDKIRFALDRTVPISDPDYIIGEEESISQFNLMFKSLNVRASGLLGCVVVAQIGNGKTHFLRYIRKYYSETTNDAIALFVPDMFVSGPLADALNGIYRSMFDGAEHQNLKCYLSYWKDYEDELINTSVQDHPNPIIRYLMLCNNDTERNLVLDYFSGKDLIPDQLKFLRNRFGLKKKFINNENDFCTFIGYSLEFLQLILRKNILLLLDEMDKVYSAETKNSSMSRVTVKVLDAYRMLFNHLNSKMIKGIICIGATGDAWNVLSNFAAFGRRFDSKIILKSPKSKDDCINFIFKRLQELNFSVANKDEEFIVNKVNSLKDDDRKTWADIINNLKNESDKGSKPLQNSPVEEIMAVLVESIAPLTWTEITEQSVLLKKLYPKSQPTSILNKLAKDKKIKINQTRPRTYEIEMFNEEDLS